MDHLRPARVGILGVGVSAITLDDATSIISSWIDRRSMNYVCVTGVHGVMECQRDPELKAIHDQAGLVTPDGMPLVWMSRALGYRNVRRVYGPDLMRAMTAISARRGYRNFYYGGSPATVAHLKEALTQRHDGLKVVGTLSPPFRPLSEAEEVSIAAELDAAQPDIIWVGLSTPKQERWMASMSKRLRPCVMIGVGAAFDFLAGEKPQAPSWMQRNGLEWAFRMATEPRRLSGRYLRNNPAFILQAMKQLSRRSSYRQTSDEIVLSQPD